MTGSVACLVPPRNVAALAQAIETLLADSKLRQTFADAARKRAEEKFDMWRNGRRLADLLRATKRTTLHDARCSTNASLKTKVQTHPQELF